VESNKPPPHDVIPDHYTPECPICKGILLPERVKELEDANDVLSAKLALAEGGAVEYQVDVAKTVPSVTYEDLQAKIKELEKASDQWRDLYQEASLARAWVTGTNCLGETGLEYRNWRQEDV